MRGVLDREVSVHTGPGSRICIWIPVDWSTVDGAVGMVLGDDAMLREALARLLADAECAVPGRAGDVAGLRAG